MNKPPDGSIIVPPMSALALEVPQGAVMRIIDEEGGQPGDLVAFNGHNLQESFSQACTRVENRSVRLSTGARLWTSGNPRKVLFTIQYDTAGSHDLLYATCSQYALEKRFDVFRMGCEENLRESLTPWNIDTVPDPLNLFFRVTMGLDGSLAIEEEPSSSKGDFIDLRAEMDCLVAISTCSVPKNSGPNTGYVVEMR